MGGVGCQPQGPQGGWSEPGGRAARQGCSVSALGRLSARRLGVQGTVGYGLKEPLAVSLGRQLTCLLRVRQPAMPFVL